MTTPTLTAPFAAFLGLPKPPKAAASAKRPKTKPSPGRKVGARPQKAASASAPFAHLLPTDAKPLRTPQQGAPSSGAAARAVVDAYSQATVTAPPGPQTAPSMSATAEKALAAQIIAAGRKRRGETS